MLLNSRNPDDIDALARYPSYSYSYTRVLWRNQMEQYPMCIAGNLAWLHHMCILHTSAGTTVQAVHWACICDFTFLFFLIHPLFLSTSPPTHFSFSVFLCACMYMTSIWWIKSNALILSQSRPLPHVRIKIRETPSLCVSFRVSGNKTTTGFLSVGLHLPPKTTGLPCFPMWLECISENSSPQYVKHNTKKQLMFQRLTVGMALSSRSHVLS